MCRVTSIRRLPFRSGPFSRRLLFRFTGVGLVPARALTIVVFGLTLLSAYGLSRKVDEARRQGHPGARDGRSSGSR